MVVGALSAINPLVFWNGPVSCNRRTVVRYDPTTVVKTTVVEEDRYSGVWAAP
jgi:hypothetical protein